MELIVQCPKCNTRYRLDRSAAGRQVSCPKCGNSFTVEMGVDETRGPKMEALSEEPPAGSPGSSGSADPAARSSEVGQAYVESTSLHEIVTPRSIGPYAVRRRLGEGGMGEVWLAYDHQLDREVAIKTLPSRYAANKDHLRRFLREARLAAKLHHTNTVTIYQVGTEGDLVYLAMEFVDGESLDKAVAPERPMGWREATEAIRDAARGLAAAHQLGLIHRDIKPANLMRTRNGVTKVADFGLARSQFAETRLTQEGAVLGTPRYMSPEQWTGGQVDARSDLYSLVCAYYCLLTGRDPFSEVAPAALRHMHCHEPLPDPRQFTPKLPDAVCRILALGTHKTPQDRYQSASDLLAELDALLAASEESLTFGAPWEPLQGISGGEPSPARVERSEGTPAATAGLASQTKNMPRASTIAGKPLWSRQRIAIAGIGLSVLVLLGVVIYVTTNHGFVQIELPDPSANVEVKVDGDTVDVEGLAEPLRMTVGAHDLEVMSGGFQTFTKSFTVKRGQTEVVWVVFEPSPPLAVAPFSADEGRQHQQRWATFLGRRAVEGNSIGMKFVLIPAGEFTMGSPDSDKDASDDEKPSHRVRITRPYYLGATEVTQAQYFRVLGERPSYYSPAQLKIASTDDLPVESVAWKDAVRFCQKLTELENVGDSLRLKWKYRLPTEAEWEFACRGGSTSRWPTGDAPSDAKSIAWVAQGEPGSPRTVGSLQPHFGLYDMVGNVREFCSDWFGKYEPQDQTDPTGPASGTKHVIRGGCYYYRWEDSRCAARFANDDAAPNVGFRVVLEP